MSFYYEDMNNFVIVSTVVFHICRPFFASSLLGLVRTLLEQMRQYEMRILGCSTLVDFINSQVATM